LSPTERSGFWEGYRGSASDPRTIVTPDAFSVHPDLLGLPLGQHPKRMVAMAVDLLLVAVVTQAGGLLLGILVAVLLLRATFKRKEEGSPSLMGTAFRGVVGCFGALVLLVTAIVLVSSVSDRVGSRDTPGTTVRGGTDGAPTLDTRTLTGWEAGAFALMSLREARRFHQAEDEAEARRLANTLAERARAIGLTEDEVREGLGDIARDDAPWRAAIDGWELEAFRDEAEVPEAAPEEAPEDPQEVEPAPEDDAAQDDPEVEEAPEPDLVVSPEIADSFRILQERLEDESRRRASAEQSVTEMTEELDATRRDTSRVPGIRAFLRRVADDLGVGFGWAALYFTVFTTWWNGRTPGKRLMRLRVVRLSGEPLTWWDSFERYGGYAAGFATGLLGFAQVYWDPNRQAIHDRIGRTVVIQDGKPPVPGRWKAATPKPSPSPIQEPGKKP